MDFRKLAVPTIATAIIGIAPPASATYNNLLFQGVTFEALSSGNTLTLIIRNALTGATGNWADVEYLKAFEIKDIGNVTGASLNGWISTVDQGLASNAGCTTGGTPGACFYQTTAVPLTDFMTFSIAFAGTDLNLVYPSLKVQFFTDINDTRATGDLLSLPIPEPEIYAMMAVGLGFVGWAARRRKSKDTAAA